MTDSKLPRPMRDVLDVPVSEAQIAAGWRAVRDRTERKSSNARPVAIAGAVAFAAAVGLALIVLRPTHAPLTRHDGGSLENRITGGDTTDVRLSDGSRIELARGAELRLLDNDDERFMVLLERGRARFQVDPSTERTWVIEADLLSVEVTGTRFVVERGERSARVRVEEGRVIVRGDRIANRVRALRAGEEVEVVLEREPVAPTIEVQVDPPPARTPVEPAPVEAAPPPTPRAPAPRQAPADRLAEADAARRAGRIDDALAILAEVARSRGEDAAVASLTRGRLLLERDRVREAILDLERVRSLRPPRAILEVALGLLVTAHRRNGDEGRAHAAAEEYRARFPSGVLLENAP